MWHNIYFFFLKYSFFVFGGIDFHLGQGRMDMDGKVIMAVFGAAL